MLNYQLMALLEASKKKAADADTDTAAEDTPDTAEAEDTDAAAEEDADADDASGEDEESTNDNEDSTEDENEDSDNEEEDNEESEDGESSEEDFSMNPDEGEDDEPPPDGLVDPDDDGSGDMGDDEAEVNVQTNILQLSKLDRTLAKRKNYHDYQDLRTSINSFRTIVDENEAVVDPDIRELVMEDLDRLYTQITDYLTYKFMITNYEENLQNYMLFMKSLNSIVMRVTVEGGKKPTPVKKEQEEKLNNNRKIKKDKK